MPKTHASHHSRGGTKTSPDSASKHHESVAVGIDLATTKCAIAHFHNGHVQVIARCEGHRDNAEMDSISVPVLHRLKQSAEEHLGQAITHAVIAVPASLTLFKRHAIREACRMAGFHVLRVMSETSAVACSMFDKGLEEKEMNVLTVDLGGGCVTVSVLFSEMGLFEIKAVSCVQQLGGQQFDSRIMDHILGQIISNGHLDTQSIHGDKIAMGNLRRACEEAKKELSTKEDATIKIDSLFNKSKLCSSITRTKFEELCTDLFEDILMLVDKTLKEAKLTIDDVKEILVVGGSSRIPKIRKLLQDFFAGREISQSVHPEEATVRGAAAYAAMMCGDDHQSISKLRLLEIAPMPIGVETSGGIMTFLIDQNAVVLTNHRRTFTTRFDNQPVATIKIYEGESVLCKNNQLLGRLNVTGIPLVLRGIPQIEVDIETGSDHCSLSVLVKEMMTGKILAQRDFMSATEDDEVTQCAAEYAVEAYSSIAVKNSD